MTGILDRQVAVQVVGSTAHWRLEIRVLYPSSPWHVRQAGFLGMVGLAKSYKFQGEAGLLNHIRPVADEGIPVGYRNLGEAIIVSILTK